MPRLLAGQEQHGQLLQQELRQLLLLLLAVCSDTVLVSPQHTHDMCWVDQLVAPAAAGSAMLPAAFGSVLHSVSSSNTIAEACIVTLLPPLLLLLLLQQLLLLLVLPRVTCIANTSSTTVGGMCTPRHLAGRVTAVCWLFVTLLHAVTTAVLCWCCYKVAQCCR
jgi:hypothetical protein